MRADMQGKGAATAERQRRKLRSTNRRGTRDERNKKEDEERGETETRDAA